ncbi:MAG: biotin/lipoyl-containing protein [Planctomycetota bacterium]
MNGSQNSSLIVQREEDGSMLLKSPGVGRFTAPASAGQVLTAGQRAGTILTLGRPPEHLIVPDSLQGAWRIEQVAPHRENANDVFLPVGFDEVLYVLQHAAAEAEGAQGQSETGQATGGSLVLRSPQSGRFYHRPAPGEPAFAAEGDAMSAGQPVGLLEIMKTYHRVQYGAAGLPETAQFVRYLTEDGGDVSEGDPLLEVRAS